MMQAAHLDLVPDVPTAAPTTALVVGVVTSRWIVEQISVDGPSVLGVPASSVIGASLLRFVHPGDVADLEAAARGARESRTGRPVVLQVGHPGSWNPVRVMVTPMVDGDLGFAITGSTTEDPQHRTTLLEQHLWRIAREIAAAGIPMVPEPGPDLESLPGMDELSPRQWEVLRRLLQGERVPGIARNLYVSPSTVRNHLTAIFAKVGVHSQEELIERVRSMANPSLCA